jgi:hypothetical protein
VSKKRKLLPPSYAKRHGHAERVELSSDRQFRARNTAQYRLNHLPIWIWVFFIAPGTFTFNLFAHGFDTRLAIWLAVVVAGTGIAGWFGQLPGVEPAPYIVRFDEDRPNPWYRRICYTMAWSEIISYAVLNTVGLVDAIIHGAWRMRYFYDIGYLPIAGTCWLLGLVGWLPRVRRSTAGEGRERRYFSGSLWAVCVAQPVLWLTWGIFPQTRPFNIAKLLIFLSLLALVGNQARRGLLPRTRPILPGELAISD